jgi:hypothetical protein
MYVIMPRGVKLSDEATIQSKLERLMPVFEDWKAEVCPKCFALSDEEFVAEYKKEHPYMFRQEK